MVALMVLSMMSSLTLANGPDKPIAVGGIAGTQNRLSLGDYNLFNFNKFSTGAYRYGTGVSRLSVGDGIGISASSINGGFVYGNTDSIFGVGVEPFSGKIQADTNGKSETYYQWVPALSVGPKLGPVMLAYRLGASIGSQGYTDLLPRLNSAQGAVVYLHTKQVRIGLEHTSIGNGSSLNTIDLQTSKYGARVESDTGLNKETSVMLLLRF